MAKRAAAAGAAGASLPAALRQGAYPLGYRPLLERKAGAGTSTRCCWRRSSARKAASTRQAFSAASARGLTQFILPTAQQLAEKHQLGELQALDLHQPAVAIELGAAYLAELAKTFGGRLPPMVAAYNAGAPQARLWQSYCKSGRSGRIPLARSASKKPATT